MPVSLEHTDPTSQERRGTGQDLCRTSDWSTKPPWLYIPPFLTPILSLLPLSAKIYTCLDIKDNFFCICFTAVSQPIFAFEWEDPAGGTKQQLTWTCLPQGFKNLPTIFGEALASDLDSFQPERFGCCLLLAAKNGEGCWEGTKALLELLIESD